MKMIKKCFPIFIRKSVFEGKNYVGRFSKIYFSKIGFATYFGQKCTFIKASIGKYCSIGSNVCVVNGSHPLNCVSTHPAFYSKYNCTGVYFDSSIKYTEYQYVDKEEKFYIDIGNDVWIGNNVVIMQGVKIGSGAVIATGSVVTRDVEPYSIVAGVPARIIRKRFDEDTISFLLNFKWWDKGLYWIKNNSKFFTDPCKLRSIGE